MRRAWITPRRLLALACAAALVCSFLPLPTASAIGSRARHGVLLLITPVTDVLHGVSLSLRGAEPGSPGLGDEARLEQDLLQAYQYNRQLEQQNTALREQIARLEQTQGVQGGAGVRLVDARVTAAGGDAASPALSFRRSETTIIPFQESSSLVVSGMYRITRNPMYLGMVTILTGIAMLTGSLSPFVIPIIFVPVLNRRVIRHEEAMLEQAFGGEYRDYQRRVRRWL